MLSLIFRINFFNTSLLHGLGEGHDKDDRIRLTKDRIRLTTSSLSVDHDLP